MTRHAGDIDCSYNAQHATEQVLCRLKTAAIDSSYTPFVLLHLRSCFYGFFPQFTYSTDPRLALLSGLANEFVLFAKHYINFYSLI